MGRGNIYKRVLLLLFAFCAGSYLGTGILSEGVKASENGNLQRAIKLFTRACNSRIYQGCYNLGVFYDIGKGVAKDKEKAAKLYLKACHLGLAKSCNNLGVLYYLGEGVRLDKSMARDYFDKACKGGVELGCRNYLIIFPKKVKR